MMKEKEILEKTWLLSEEHKFKEVIDFIEGLGREERTPQLVIELAKAYRDLAVFDSQEDGVNKKLLEKALELLQSIESQYGEEKEWSFCMGTVMFYLNRMGDAFFYFVDCEGGEPDEKVDKLIDKCIERLGLPVFKNPFYDRMKLGWERFAEGEERLRGLISKKAKPDDILSCCHELLKGIFTNVCFELGFNGKKYELILSPEKDRYMLFVLDAFKKLAPEAVLEHWDILLGRQHTESFKSKDFLLSFQGMDISPSKFRVKLEMGEKSSQAAAKAYCKEMLPFLEKNEGEAYWYFDLLLDSVIGEIANMRYISRLELVKEPFSEGDGDVPMTELPEIIRKLREEKGDDGSAENYLEVYSCYEMKPREEEENFSARTDVFAGSSRCVPTVSAFLNNDPSIVSRAYNDGIAVGFLFYPVWMFEATEEKKRSDIILDFREELEQYISDQAGDKCVFVGGASGVECGYLDFLAWDLRAVLNSAQDFFKKREDIPWAAYQSFWSGARCVMLKDDRE